MPPFHTNGPTEAVLGEWVQLTLWQLIQVEGNHVQITKLEAAVRQLDTAIQLFFEDRDPVAVCTLAAAAGRVFSDLVEHHLPNQSWRSTIVTALPHISRREIYFTMDRTPNFLKHADQDPDAIESFNECENEHRLFIACDEWVVLGCNPSIEMQVLQIWYVAANLARFKEKDDPALVADAHRYLPNLSTMDRRMQVSVGAAFLAEKKRLLESELAL